MFDHQHVLGGGTIDASSLPTDHELLHLQQTRQQDSDWVLERINLWPILQQYGIPHLVGAKALGLMIARDIDITLAVSESMQTHWTQLTHDLMLTPHVRKVTAIDYYNYDHQQHYAPATGQRYSYYISMDKLLGPDGNANQLWECQIHLRASAQYDVQYMAQIQHQLTHEAIAAILRIKYWAHVINTILKPASHNNFKIPSPAIYTAVLESEERNIAKFAAAFRSQVPEQYCTLYDSTVAMVNATLSC